ncbi:DNA translocase FtsK, partial [Sinorhizobium fredii]
MRIPRTNFSTAALHDADYADDFEHPHPGAPGDSHVQTTRASAQDHLFEAPEAPRRGADDMGYAGRAARLYGHGSAYAPAQVTASTRDPLPTLAEITGQSDGPSWESHFFLSPNVRFTRTPEREFMKRRAPAADASEAAVDEIALESDEQEAVAEAAPVDAAPPAPETEAPAHSPSELLRVLMQQLPSWRPAQIRNAESAADAALVAVDEPSVAAEPQVVLTPAVSAVEVAPLLPVGREAAPDTSELVMGNETNARLSYLSDHAFFEFMPLEIAAAPQVVVEPVKQPAKAPAQIAAAPKPFAMPKVEIRRQPPTAITSMFRVVECRPAATAVPAPIAAATQYVTKDPVQAAAAAPAETVEPVVSVKAEEKAPVPDIPVTKAAITMPAVVQRSSSPFPPIGGSERQQAGDAYEFPSKELLQEPPQGQGFFMTQEQLEQNAGLLESVLEDFGVKGEIIHVRPGPVVTLYEFEPAPGVKSSRVIGLADDIARSMSALSARVAVVPGRNVIGIELPNATRETVYFRELIESDDFRRTGCKLALCLGKTIGG